MNIQPPTARFLSRLALAAPLALALLAAPALLVNQASAATLTWNGAAGGTGDWSAANWVSGTPAAGDLLQFGGTTTPITNNNITADTNFIGINLTNNGSAGQTSNFTLSGNRITLGGNIDTTAATTGSLTDTISLAMILSATHTITTNTDHNLTISGVISSSGNLTKSGTGTLTLSGVNTYTGITTINAGTLKITNNNALGSSSRVDLIGTVTGTVLEFGSDGLDLSQAIRASNSGASRSIRLDLAGTNTGTISSSIDIRLVAAGNFTIDVGVDDTLTAAGNIYTGASGGAGITKTGLGTLNLSGSNSYAGTTTISAGTLALSGGSAIPNSGAVTLANATSTALNVNSSETIGNLSGGGSLGGNIAIASGQTLTVNQTSSLTYNGSISGAGGLTINGTSQLQLMGNNSYTGMTTVNSGTLRLQGPNPNPTIVGDITINGGALTLGASSQIADTSSVTLTNGSLELSTLAETIASITMSGGTLRRAGATFTLNSASSFTGGSLNFAATSGRINTSGTTTLGNVTFDLSVSGNATTGLYLGGDIVVNASTTANFTNSGGGLGRIDLNAANRTIDVGAGGAMNVGWTIAGTSVGITKNGTGTLTLNASNTFTGAVVINAGTVATGSAGLLADTTNVTINSGGNYMVGAADTIASISGSGDLRLNAGLAIGNSTFSGSISGASAITTSGTLNFSGDNTNWSGGISVGTSAAVLIAGADNAFGNGTIVGANPINVTIRSSNATDRTLANSIARDSGAGGTMVLGSAGTGNLTIQGGYSNTNNFNLGTFQVDNAWTQINGAVASSSTRYATDALVKTGNGTLILNGNNTYIPDTTISAGTLQIGASGRLGGGSYSSNIAINGLTSTFLYSGTSAQTLSGVISGNGALTLATTAPSTLTLSNAANTYTGATTVNAGTLAVSGNISSSALTLNSGGVISAGSSTAVTKFNAGSITINGGSGYNWTLSNGALATTAGTDYDQISTAGALSFNNTEANPFTIFLYGNATGWDGSLNNSWNIMSAGSVTGFNSANFSVNFTNFGVASANRAGIWSFASTGGNITMSYTLATPDYYWHGTTGNWDDTYVANTTGFTPGIPENDKNLFFTGTGGTTTNDIASGTLSSINFLTFNSTAGAYTLAANAGSAGASGGTALTVKGDIVNNSASTQTINLDIAMGGSSTGIVNTAAGNIAMGGKISGTAALTKSGTGTLILSGSNTYSGGTAIDAGTIQIDHANGLGSTGSIAFGGGGLTYGSAITTDISSRIKNSAGVVLIDIGSNDVTYASAVDSTNSGGLTKNGSGTLTLSANNTYSGATTINAGTLQVTSTGRLGGGTYSGNIDNNGTLLLGSNSNQTLSGLISGTGAITKNGTGTLTISNAASTHSGTLTINTGTLAASGSISSSVVLNSGVRISVGTAAASAQFNAGSLTIGAGTGYAFTISNVNTSTAGTDYDQIALSGGLTLGNTAASPFTVYLNGTPTGWSNSGIYSWNIISAASLSGTFAAGNFTTDFTSFGIAAGSRTGNWTFSNPTAGTIRLSYIGTASGNSTWSTTTGNWNTAAQWAENAIPVNFNNLTFNGTGGTATNNISNATLTTVNDITFAAGAGSYTLAANAGSSGASGGKALTLTGDITNNSGNASTINTALSIANSPIINTASGNITIGGVISGVGGITKQGTNTLTLNATNTFTGAVVINAGTLATGSAGLLANTVNVTVNSGGNYTIGAADTINSISGSGVIRLNAGLTLLGNSSFSGSISGSSAITISGASAIVTLSGNNSGWSGGTVLDGVLALGSNNGAGTGNIDFVNGTTLATIRSADSSHRTISNTMSKNSGATMTAYFGSASTGNLTFTGDFTWQFGRAYTLQVDNAWTQFNGAMSVSDAASNISSTAWVKSGNGTLILNGNNTYALSTTISAGTLQIGASGRLGAGNYSSNITINGLTSAFVYSGTNSQTLSGIISGNGALTQNGSGTLTLSGNNTKTGTTTISAGTIQIAHANALGSSGNITFGGGTLQYGSGITTDISSRLKNSSSAILVDTNGNNITFASALDSTNSGGLTKNGTGTLTLSGNNTYTGATRINTGTIEIGATGRLGGGTYSGNLVNSGALIYSGTNNQTLSGIISGTGALTQNAASTLTLSGNNTYTGGTTITAGTIQIASSGLLGGGNYSGNISNSGSFVFSSNRSQTLSGIMSGAGALTQSAASTLTLSGNNTYTGATTISAGTLQISSTGLLGGGSYSGNIANNGSLVLASNSNQILSGIISGTGALTKNGSGTLTLSGSSTYSGATTLNTGTLVIGNAAAAGTGTITQASGSSLLQIDTTGTIANNMSVYNVLATQNATLSGAISVNNASWDIETGDTLTISGAVSGNGGVTKNGNGTLILSGSNSYTSATTVNAGTLTANNANALGSNTTVQINGGSLLVTADDAINGKNITLASTAAGSASAASLAFSGTYNGTAGSLTLSENSTIDLGTGSVVLHFTDMILGFQKTLAIYNWTGTTLWGGGNGNNTDQFYVGRNLTNNELNRISFYSGIASSSFVGTGFQLSGGSFNQEIIPVPEPETWATGILLVLSSGAWLWRRRKHASICGSVNRSVVC